jgi:preprotein translocase subunit YajC
VEPEFKEYLFEVHSNSYYQQTCLLNVLLVATFNFIKKAQRTKSTLSQQAQDSLESLDTVVLQSVDQIMMRQIRLVNVNLALIIEPIPFSPPPTKQPEHLTWLRVNKSCYDLQMLLLPKYLLKNQ